MTGAFLLCRVSVGTTGDIDGPMQPVLLTAMCSAGLQHAPLCNRPLSALPAAAATATACQCCAPWWGVPTTPHPTPLSFTPTSCPPKLFAALTSPSLHSTPCSCQLTPVPSFPTWCLEQVRDQESGTGPRELQQQLQPCPEAAGWWGQALQPMRVGARHIRVCLGMCVYVGTLLSPLWVERVGEGKIPWLAPQARCGPYFPRSEEEAGVLHSVRRSAPAPRIGGILVVAGGTELSLPFLFLSSRTSEAH